MAPRTREFDLKLEKLLQVLSRSQAVFTRGVVPLFYDDENRRPQLWGTALTVQHARNTFLVSAKHVLREPELYMYSSPGEKRYLSGSLHDTSDDKFDIGVLKLEGERLPPYPDLNCFPLTLDAFVPVSGPLEGNLFLGLGYPSTRTRTNTQTKSVLVRPYANFGPAISAERQAKLGYDPGNFIAVTLRQSRVFGANGKIQTFPDPHGMSGSPLFHLYDSNAKVNYLGGARVAGILTRHLKDQTVMIATHIGVAPKLILGFSA